MRFPSAANSSPDCVAEAGDGADGAWPLAIAASPTARICSRAWPRICSRVCSLIWARIKEAAPISSRVKTANPAIAGKRRNVLDAAKIIASIRPYWPHGGEPKPRALQTSLPGPSPFLPISADAKERQNVLSFAVGRRQAEARRYVTAKRAVRAAPLPRFLHKCSF